jgi:hypothetical protein
VPDTKLTTGSVDRKSELRVHWTALFASAALHKVLAFSGRRIC